MDTLGNLLTSIRNAEMARHAATSVPASKASAALLEILKANGYIKGFSTRSEGVKQLIDVTLTGDGVVHHYKRISKPGRRLYTDAKNIPVVLRGMGMVVISTSAGMMTGKQARKQKLGGELICEVY